MWYIFNLIERLTLTAEIYQTISETNKGLERVTRVQSAGILSFVLKYHIWKHEDFGRVCFLYVTTHAMAF